MSTGWCVSSPMHICIADYFQVPSPSLVLGNCRAAKLEVWSLQGCCDVFPLCARNTHFLVLVVPPFCLIAESSSLGNGNGLLLLSWSDFSKCGGANIF